MPLLAALGCDGGGGLPGTTGGTGGQATGATGGGGRGGASANGGQGGTTQRDPFFDGWSSDNRHYAIASMRITKGGSEASFQIGVESPSWTSHADVFDNCLKGQSSGNNDGELRNPGNVSVTTPTGEQQLSPFSATIPLFFLRSPEGTPFWKPGDQVTMKTTGGDAPALSTTLTFPANVQVTLPSAEQPIDLGKDLVVPFTAEGSEPAFVSVTESFFEGTSQRRLWVVCHAKPGETAVTVPRQLLQGFSADNGNLLATPPVNVTAGRRAHAIVRLAEFEVEEEATVTSSVSLTVTR